MRYTSIDVEYGKIISADHRSRIEKDKSAARKAFLKASEQLKKNIQALHKQEREQGNA